MGEIIGVYDAVSVKVKDRLESGLQTIVRPLKPVVVKKINVTVSIVISETPEELESVSVSRTAISVSIKSIAGLVTDRVSEQAANVVALRQGAARQARESPRCTV